MNWKTNPYIAVVLVVLLAVAIWLMVRSLIPQRQVEYQQVVMCTHPDCGYIFWITTDPTTQPPYECDKCHLKTAYLALRCVECGEIFPQTGTAADEELHCPKCQSRKVRRLDDVPNEEP